MGAAIQLGMGGKNCFSAEYKKIALQILVELMLTVHYKGEMIKTVRTAGRKEQSQEDKHKEMEVPIHPAAFAL